MDPYQTALQKCKEHIDRIPCRLNTIACQKGKYILMHKCIQNLQNLHSTVEASTLSVFSENTCSKIATCSKERDGGAIT